MQHLLGSGADSGAESSPKSETLGPSMPVSSAPPGQPRTGKSSDLGSPKRAPCIPEGFLKGTPYRDPTRALLKALEGGFLQEPSASLESRP